MRTEYLYRQVERKVQGLIEGGVLVDGERVPSLRQMSRQAGVSLATVTQAYLELERKGLLEARPKSGFFVRERPGPEIDVPASAKPHMSPRRVQFGDLSRTVFTAAHDPTVQSFATALPSLALLPEKGVARALGRTISRAGTQALQYGPPDGLPDLRRQIALRLANIGSPVAPDDVLVTNGVTEAVAISLRAVAKPGDVVAVESPCYFATLELIERLGLLALEVGTDVDTGLRIDSLEQALDDVDVRAMLLVPNFSNPLGSLMPATNKRRLVELLAEREIALIEDDIYGDLHFGERRPELLRAYDRQDTVITCSSFSKSLAPGLRVGWMLPGRHASAARSWKRSMSLATSSLGQLAVAEFLASGRYERYLRDVRAAYREQVARMRGAIAESFPPETRVTRPQGGFVLWVQLPPSVDGMELFHRALERGVAVTPGALFSPTRKFNNFIRICCGSPWSEDLAAAVAILGTIAAELARDG